MAKRCPMTGKAPLTGNRVSHSNIKTKRRQLPNLKSRRYFLPSEGRWVRLRISTSAMRTIDKIGIEAALEELRRLGEKV